MNEPVRRIVRGGEEYVSRDSTIMSAQVKRFDTRVHRCSKLGRCTEFSSLGYGRKYNSIDPEAEEYINERCRRDE